MQAQLIQRGDAIDYTPTSAKSGGDVAVEAGIPGVTQNDIAANKLGALLTVGVFKIVKKNEAIAKGAFVYWDATGDPYTGTAGTGAATSINSGDTPLGIALAAAGATDLTVNVKLIGGVDGSSQLRFGLHTTVAAVDTIATGLSKVIGALACPAEDVTDALAYVSTAAGNQSGAPAAGSFYLKTWKTSGTDPTPIAADAFSKLVAWIAFGY